MRRLILIPMLAFVCASAVAQRGFPGAHFGAHFGPRSASHHNGHSRGGVAYPLGPLYWDSLFFDDYLDFDYPASSPSVLVIQQPTLPQAGNPEPQANPPAPSLLIELRGGRYVRIREDESSFSENTDPQNTDRQSVSDGSQSYPLGASHPSAPPPSTLLVFRDGSREQISDYTIADGVLYAQANYFTEGLWNKPIVLSSLDLSATITENRARGLQFRIPAAPNQVIVGP